MKAEFKMDVVQARGTEVKDRKWEWGHWWSLTAAAVFSSCLLFGQFPFSFVFNK